jgi:hypothetical protein
MSEAKTVAAMIAHTHLNIFATIVTILEGGVIYGSGSADKAKIKIIAICKAEQQRQLTLMDKATGRTPS